jgi:hypothetical protein
MADEGPKLSQQELTAVLRKAAERESLEGPRAFTAEDVVAAGRELGLARGTVEAVLAEHLARKNDLTLVPRPFDTRIMLDVSPDRFVAHLPARGPNLQAVTRIGLSALVLPFIAFWTDAVLSQDAPAVMAVMALPFWAAGLSMLGSGIGSMLTSQRLELTRAEGRLVSQPFGVTRRLRPSELRPRLDRIRINRQRVGAEAVSIPVLAIDHGTRTYRLLPGFSEAEHRWLKSELERWLAG